MDFHIYFYPKASFVSYLRIAATLRLRRTNMIAF